MNGSVQFSPRSSFHAIPFPSSSLFFFSAFRFQKADEKASRRTGEGNGKERERKRERKRKRKRVSIWFWLWICNWGDCDCDGDGDVLPKMASRRQAKETSLAGKEKGNKDDLGVEEWDKVRNKSF